MANIEKLEEILKKEQQDFRKLDPATQNFVYNRIFGGNSIFGWPERVLHIAYGFFQRRHRNSSEAEMLQDHQTAELIVKIQQLKSVKRNLRY